ncbi:hypothetical protein R1sor_014180 [Riccia sorocarpa]|uniref:DDRGK domain-containing protein 1 n=1 Tax=Riccia sorocarpa TaxID=122646 RepID=A0ABD3HAL9_9MARC
MFNSKSSGSGLRDLEAFLGTQEFSFWSKSFSGGANCQNILANWTVERGERAKELSFWDKGRDSDSEKMEQVAWFLVLLMAMIVAPLLMWSRRERRRRRGIPSSADTSEEIQREETTPLGPSGMRERLGGGTRRMRRRNVSGASSSSSSTPPTVAETNGYEDEEDQEIVDSSYYTAKASKKKLEKKQEKEERKQAELASRELRREKQDKHAEKRRQKDEEREAEGKRKEEEAEQQKLKEEEAANAEFEKWKSAFSIDTEGTQEQDVQVEGQGLLNDFVDYIKKHKCVGLEDLAAEFNLRTQDCINRVLALEQMGRISGVMDDRGKFIYISPEEMRAVAEYIKRLGRVSIAHLASKSNEFIDLESKNVASDVPKEIEPEEVEPFLPSQPISAVG